MARSFPLAGNATRIPLARASGLHGKPVTIQARSSSKPEAQARECGRPHSHGPRNADSSRLRFELAWEARRHPSPLFIQARSASKGMRTASQPRATRRGFLSLALRACMGSPSPSKPALHPSPQRKQGNAADLTSGLPGGRESRGAGLPAGSWPGCGAGAPTPRPGSVPSDVVGHRPAERHPL